MVAGAGPRLGRLVCGGWHGVRGGAFWTPRVRGNSFFRPLKCAIVLALVAALYWAATSLVFHYVYGVDVWSPALWREIEKVWRAGGNLRWSAL